MTKGQANIVIILMASLFGAVALGTTSILVRFEKISYLTKAVGSLDVATIELITHGPIVSPVISADIDGDGYADLAYLNAAKRLEIQFSPSEKRTKKEMVEIVAVGVETSAGGYEYWQEITLIDSKSEVIRFFVNEKTDRRIAKMAEFAAKFNPFLN